VKLNIPSLPEQTKIANFLTAVDDKITLLTKKADLLSQYKKGVMQQIFSQELRFKDDDGQEFPEWGIKKLSDEDIYISDGNYGEQYPKANELKQAGVPFIRANNMSGLSLSWADMKFIDNSLHEMLTSVHLETDDILITTRGEIGMVAYVNSDFNGANINAQICLIRIKDKHKINSKYLVQLLSSSFCQRQFKELQTGSALKQLPKKNLSQVDFYCPITEEQNKIANFLTAIDEKITSNQTQLDAVKQYKQGLLQQMFV
jgi:type I restriction enzyme S subunit